MQRPVVTVLRWSWLLGIALLAPAALPLVVLIAVSLRCGAVRRVVR